MKKIRTMLAAALVCVAMPMSAQFSNSPSRSSAASSADEPASYSRFSVGYNSNTLSSKDDDESLNGFAVQLLAGKKISDTMPLYIEYGGRLTMGFYSDEEVIEHKDESEIMENSLTKMSVSVPVNLTYRFNVGRNAVIAPYAGVHLTGNILGRGKYDYRVKDNYKDDYYEKYYDDDDSKTINMFDKDDVGKDGQWTRLQYGMQIGTNISFDKFNIGLEYSLDFNDICKKVSTSDFMVSVGYNF